MPCTSGMRRQRDLRRGCFKICTGASLKLLVWQNEEVEITISLVLWTLIHSWPIPTYSIPSNPNRRSIFLFSLWNQINDLMYMAGLIVLTANPTKNRLVVLVRTVSSASCGTSMFTEVNLHNFWNRRPDSHCAWGYRRRRRLLHPELIWSSGPAQANYAFHPFKVAELLRKTRLWKAAHRIVHWFNSIF